MDKAQQQQQHTQQPSGQQQQASPVPAASASAAAPPPAEPAAAAAQNGALPAVERGRVLAVCTQVSVVVAALGFGLRWAAPLVSPAVRDGYSETVTALLDCKCGGKESNAVACAAIRRSSVARCIKVCAAVQAAGIAHRQAPRPLNLALLREHRERAAQRRTAGAGRRCSRRRHGSARGAAGGLARVPGGERALKPAGEGGSGAAGVQGVEGKQREGRGRHAGLSRASRCRWFLAIRPSVAHLRQLACLSRRCSRRWAGQT